MTLAARHSIKCGRQFAYASAADNRTVGINLDAVVYWERIGCAGSVSVWLSGQSAAVSIPGEFGDAFIASMGERAAEVKP